MSSDITSARAAARFVRVAPMKIRRVLDTVRGESADEALNVLEYVPQGAANPVAKVVTSAAANTKSNFGLDRRTLIISETYADEGPAMEHFRPRVQDRVFHIRKRTSHITMVVGSQEEGNR